MNPQLRLNKRTFSNLVASRKMTLEELSGYATISDDTVSFDTFEQLRQTAAALNLPVTSLLQEDDDLDEGVMVCRGLSGYQRTEERDGIPYYTYTHLANSRAAPKLMSLHLTLHCNEPAKVVLNEGHGAQEFVYVLRGEVRMDWKADGQPRSEMLKQGDSIYVHPGVPHSFIAAGPSAEILAVNF